MYGCKQSPEYSHCTSNYFYKERFRFFSITIKICTEGWAWNSLPLKRPCISLKTFPQKTAFFCLSFQNEKQFTGKERGSGERKEKHLKIFFNLN